MPIYEYRCGRCGHEFEKLIRTISAKRDVRCEACGAADTDKLVSAFAFSTGDGFSSSGGGETSCSSCTLPNCNSCK